MELFDLSVITGSLPQFWRGLWMTLQLTGFALRLVKRLTGYGQLRACLTKTVDFRRLTVQVTQPFLCVANITREGFTRGLDGFKRSGRLVDRFQQYLKPQVITHCGFRYAVAPFRAM